MHTIDDTGLTGSWYIKRSLQMSIPIYFMLQATSDKGRGTCKWNVSQKFDANGTADAYPIILYQFLRLFSSLSPSRLIVSWLFLSNHSSSSATRLVRLKLKWHWGLFNTIPKVQSMNSEIDIELICLHSVWARAQSWVSFFEKNYCAHRSTL